jgi:tetratricopeptide (TPR) repeat protein
MISPHSRCASLLARVLASALGLGLGLAAAVVPGEAQGAGIPALRHTERPAIADSARARAKIAELLEEAYALEHEAGRSSDDEARVSLLQRAASVAGRALALDEHHAEARLLRGQILAHSAMGEAALRDSVPELRRARDDDRSRALEVEIAAALGIALSRLGRFEEALREYDRALALLGGQPGSPARLRSYRANYLGNSAEVLMALGRLPEAIARYAQAEALETSELSALHTLGLAVAYDRDGQIEKSREALHRSLTADPAMKAFQSDSVFFVPAGERHYYEALTAEAFGERERAIQSFQLFLRELPKSRYAARARAHMDALRRTPGLSADELLRAEVTIGAPLFPPERPGALAAPGRRRRSEEDIERVILSHRTDLRTCYARALRQDGQLTGELDVALVIDRHGAVALAEVIRVSFGDRRGAADTLSGQAARDLMRCAVDTLRRWRFPQNDADHDELALPIRFEAMPRR